MEVRKKKINVIHLVDSLCIGGTQKVVLDICSSADLRRYNLTIYTLRDNLELLSQYSLNSSIKIKRFSYQPDYDYSNFGYLKHSLFDRTISKKAHEVIKEAVIDKPDILHVHHPPRELNLGILIKRETDCKLIFTQHQRNFGKNSFGAKISGLILRRTYRKYNLIAVSRAVKNEIVKYKLLGRKKKLFLLENKLNLNLYNIKPKRLKDYISIVYLARISPGKAHIDLINAWKILENDPIKKKLYLVGPDDMDNQMQDLTKELGLEQSVVFTGARSEIPALLNECDFAVFPSHSEGLPISLLEKMAMKLPVIVSDIDSLTSIIEDEVNGLVFKCGDAEDLAKKIKILLNDENLRTKLGEKARETVEQSFGSSNIASENERVYEEIINSDD